MSGGVYLRGAVPAIVEAQTQSWRRERRERAAVEDEAESGGLPQARGGGAVREGFGRVVGMAKSAQARPSAARPTARHLSSRETRGVAGTAGSRWQAQAGQAGGQTGKARCRDCERRRHPDDPPTTPTKPQNLHPLTARVHVRPKVTRRLRRASPTCLGRTASAHVRTRGAPSSQPPYTSPSAAPWHSSSAGTCVAITVCLCAMCVLAVHNFVSHVPVIHIPISLLCRVLQYPITVHHTCVN